MKNETMLAAQLVNDVEYTRDGEKIVVAKATAIQVDVARSLAKVGNDYIDIFAEEYVLS